MPKRDPYGSQREIIVAYLKTQPGWHTTPEIIEETGVNRATVHHTLNRLAVARLIERKSIEDSRTLKWRWRK